MACHTRLPLVYKNNLITLISEVIQKQPACQTIDNVPFYAPNQTTIQNSLRLLFSHYDSPAKFAAFFLQCLSALGWDKASDLVDQLKSESEVTFSLLASYPRVSDEAGKIKEKIKKDLSSIGAKIDLSLLSFCVKLVRLLLGSLLLSSHMSEIFYEMFNHLLMKTKSPSETASVIYSILSHFHYNEVYKLGPYLIPGFSLRISYPEIYFKLRIVEFLYGLGEDKCKLAMMAFSHIYLNDEPIDKYSPLEFVGALFDRCEADIAKLNQLAGYFNQPNYFSICEQKQNESKTKLNCICFINSILADLSITPVANLIESNNDSSHSGATPLMQNEPFDEGN